MGYNSQTGQVGFGIQTLRGTPVAATRFARLRGGSVGPNRSIMIPDPEIGGNRDIPEAYMGPVGFGGTLEFYPRMQMLALLMKAALGASSSSNVAGSNEVQTLTITGTPTGGTATVRFRGENIVIPFDAAAAAVQTLFEGTNILAPGDVSCAGGPFPGAPITVTFTGATFGSTNPPAITLYANNLTGGTTPTLTPTTTTPGVEVIGTHIITPANTVPWLTVEERISATLESFQYTDAKVNSLHLEADAQGYLMGSADILAISQISDFTAQANPAYDNTPMMVGGQVAVTLNGTPFKSKAWNMDINNNIESDDFYLGSILLGDMVEKRRELKLGFTYRPEDSDLWKSATYGDSSFTLPKAGRAYRGPVSISVTSFETIGDVVLGTPYSLLVEIPHAVVAPFQLSPSGDDVIQNDLEITPIRPDPNEPICTVTIKDNLATVV